MDSIRIRGGPNLALHPLYIHLNNPLSAYFSIIPITHYSIDFLSPPRSAILQSLSCLSPGLAFLSFLVYHKFRLCVVMVGLMMILSVFQHQIKKYQKMIISSLWSTLSPVSWSCFITYGISYILSSRYLYLHLDGENRKSCYKQFFWTGLAEVCLVVFSY